MDVDSRNRQNYFALICAKALCVKQQKSGATQDLQSEGDSAQVPRGSAALRTWTHC